MEKWTSDRDRLLLENQKPVSLAEDALKYDQSFKEAYGIRLSTIVNCAEIIALKICRKTFGVEKVSQNTLYKKIKKSTNYDKTTIKKALGFLQIDKNMLSQNWVYYRLRDVPVTVSRRPIIRLIHGKANKGDILYIGCNALLRSIGLLFADIERGLIKLGDLDKQLAEEKGPDFEKEVRLVLTRYGFRVIRVSDTPPRVGDIDAIALNERKILLIIEAKAPKIDVAIDRAKWHFERSRKWCQQLKEKMDWATTNSQLLANRLGLGHVKIENIIGLVVTKVPWYVEPDLPYKVLSIEEFEKFLVDINKVT
jgi:Holliday junction resolvase-like predicted endonuclease